MQQRSSMSDPSADPSAGTMQDVVTFHPMKPLYSAEFTLTVQYTLGSEVIFDEMDWLGIFASGDLDLNHSLAFEYAAVEAFDQSQPLSRIVTFPATQIQPLAGCTKAFHVVYVGHDSRVLGVSQPFWVSASSTTDLSAGHKPRSGAAAKKTSLGQLGDCQQVISLDTCTCESSEVLNCPYDDDDDWEMATNSSDLSDIVILSSSPSKEVTTTPGHGLEAGASEEATRTQNDDPRAEPESHTDDLVLKNEVKGQSPQLVQVNHRRIQTSRMNDVYKPCQIAREESGPDNSDQLLKDSHSQPQASHTGVSHSQPQTSCSQASCTQASCSQASCTGIAQQDSAVASQHSSTIDGAETGLLQACQEHSISIYPLETKTSVFKDQTKTKKGKQKGKKFPLKKISKTGTECQCEARSGNTGAENQFEARIGNISRADKSDADVELKAQPGEGKSEFPRQLLDGKSGRETKVKSIIDTKVKSVTDTKVKSISLRLAETHAPLTVKATAQMDNSKRGSARGTHIPSCFALSETTPNQRTLPADVGYSLPAPGAQPAMAASEKCKLCHLRYCRCSAQSLKSDCDSTRVETIVNCRQEPGLTGGCYLPQDCLVFQGCPAALGCCVTQASLPAATEEIDSVALNNQREQPTNQPSTSRVKHHTNIKNKLVEDGADLTTTEAVLDKKASRGQVGQSKSKTSKVLKQINRERSCSKDRSCSKQRCRSKHRSPSKHSSCSKDRSCSKHRPCCRSSLVQVVSVCPPLLTSRTDLHFHQVPDLVSFESPVKQKEMNRKIESQKARRPRGIDKYDTALNQHLQQNPEVLGLVQAPSQSVNGAQAAVSSQKRLPVYEPGITKLFSCSQNQETLHPSENTRPASGARTNPLELSVTTVDIKPGKTEGPSLGASNLTLGQSEEVSSLNLGQSVGVSSLTLGQCVGSSSLINVCKSEPAPRKKVTKRALSTFMTLKDFQLRRARVCGPRSSRMFKMLHKLKRGCIVGSLDLVRDNVQLVRQKKRLLSQNKARGKELLDCLEDCSDLDSWSEAEARKSESPVTRSAETAELDSGPETDMLAGNMGRTSESTCQTPLSSPPLDDSPPIYNLPSCLASSIDSRDHSVNEWVEPGLHKVNGQLWGGDKDFQNVAPSQDLTSQGHSPPFASQVLTTADVKPHGLVLSAEPKPNTEENKSPPTPFRSVFHVSSPSAIAGPSTVAREKTPERQKSPVVVWQNRPSYASILKKSLEASTVRRLKISPKKPNDSNSRSPSQESVSDRDTVSDSLQTAQAVTVDMADSTVQLRGTQSTSAAAQVDVNKSTSRQQLESMLDQALLSPDWKTDHKIKVSLCENFSYLPADLMGRTVEPPGGDNTAQPQPGVSTPHKLTNQKFVRRVAILSNPRGSKLKPPGGLTSSLKCADLNSLCCNMEGGYILPRAHGEHRVPNTQINRLSKEMLACKPVVEVEDAETYLFKSLTDMLSPASWFSVVDTSTKEDYRPSSASAAPSQASETQKQPRASDMTQAVSGSSSQPSLGNSGSGQGEPQQLQPSSEDVQLAGSVRAKGDNCCDLRNKVNLLENTVKDLHAQIKQMKEPLSCEHMLSPSSRNHTSSDNLEALQEHFLTNEDRPSLCTEGHQVSLNRLKTVTEQLNTGDLATDLGHKLARTTQATENLRPLSRTTQLTENLLSVIRTTHPADKNLLPVSRITQPSNLLPVSRTTQPAVENVLPVSRTTWFTDHNSILGSRTTQPADHASIPDRRTNHPADHNLISDSRATQHTDLSSSLGLKLKGKKLPTKVLVSKEQTKNVFMKQEHCPDIDDSENVTNKIQKNQLKVSIKDHKMKLNLNGVKFKFKTQDVQKTSIKVVLRPGNIKFKLVDHQPKHCGTSERSNHYDNTNQQRRCNLMGKTQADVVDKKSRQTEDVSSCLLHQLGSRSGGEGTKVIHRVNLPTCKPRSPPCPCRGAEDVSRHEPPMDPHHLATSSCNNHVVSHAHAGSTSHAHAGSTFHAHAGSISHAHAGSTSHAHAGSTSHAHAGSASHAHAGSTSHTHAGSTSHAHAGLTSHAHAGLTSHAHAGSTSHTHAGSTSHTHAGSTSHDHAGSTSHDHAGSTSRMNQLPATRLKLPVCRGQSLTSQSDTHPCARLDTKKVFQVHAKPVNVKLVKVIPARLPTKTSCCDPQIPLSDHSNTPALPPHTHQWPKDVTSCITGSQLFPQEVFFPESYNHSENVSHLASNDLNFGHPPDSTHCKQLPDRRKSSLMPRKKLLVCLEDMQTEESDKLTSSKDKQSSDKKQDRNEDVNLKKSNPNSILSKPIKRQNLRTVEKSSDHHRSNLFNELAPNCQNCVKKRHHRADSPPKSKCSNSNSPVDSPQLTGSSSSHSSGMKQQQHESGSQVLGSFVSCPRNTGVDLPLQTGCQCSMQTCDTCQCSVQTCDMCQCRFRQTSKCWFHGSGDILPFKPHRSPHRVSTHFTTQALDQILAIKSPKPVQNLASGDTRATNLTAAVDSSLDVVKRRDLEQPKTQHNLNPNSELFHSFNSGLANQITRQKTELPFDCVYNHSPFSSFLCEDMQHRAVPAPKPLQSCCGSFQNRFNCGNNQWNQKVNDCPHSCLEGYNCSDNHHLAGQDCLHNRQLVGHDWSHQLAGHECSDNCQLAENDWSHNGQRAGHDWSHNGRLAGHDWSRNHHNWSQFFNSHLDNVTLTDTTYQSGSDTPDNFQPRRGDRDLAQPCPDISSSWWHSAHLSQQMCPPARDVTGSTDQSSNHPAVCGYQCVSSLCSSTRQIEASQPARVL